MMVFAVIKTIPGYAREDAERAHCIGVYSDEDTANKVKQSSGFGALVKQIELDTIPEGIRDFAKALGYKL